MSIFMNIDTNCQDIEEIKEYLKMTENLLHGQHYLNLIAKRYLIQLIDNPLIQSNDLNDDDGGMMEEIENKVNIMFTCLIKVID